MPERSKGLHLSCNIFGCVGSNPTPDTAWLAQSVERKTLNLVVVGSIPTSGNFLNYKQQFYFLLKE